MCAHHKFSLEEHRHTQAQSKSEIAVLDKNVTVLPNFHATRRYESLSVRNVRKELLVSPVRTLSSFHAKLTYDNSTTIKAMSHATYTQDTNIACRQHAFLRRHRSRRRRVWDRITGLFGPQRTQSVHFDTKLTYGKSITTMERLYAILTRVETLACGKATAFWDRGVASSEIG